MINYKEYYERYQIGKNDKDILTGNIENLKLVQLSSHKKLDNIDK